VRVRRLTAAEQDEARRRLARGESLRDVAAVLGCSHTTVRRLVAPGAPAPPAPASPAPAPVAPLPARLATVAAALDGVDCPSEAAAVREAIALLTAPPPAVDVEVGEVGEVGDALANARELIMATRRARADALAVGDVAAASRHARTAAMLIPVLSRCENASRQERDGFWLTRVEFEAGQAAYRERVAAATRHPLMCSRCGSEFRAELAGVTLPAALPAGAI
jgi:hypothetical protein